MALRSADLNIHSERLLKPVDWLASRPALSCLVFAAFALLLVLTKVAHRGVSVPEIHDEFSYLLAADTFAQGRITNPPHPMAVHFETMHVNFSPTYHSKYPPAQGLMLAIGQLLGHPIIGAWISTALLGGLLCWMLRGWLSPRWAMAGTLLAINQLAAGYWAHSYLGGAVAACGGALLFGALPRVMRRPNLRDSLLMGLGIIVLANSRPYEGALAALPAAIVLLRWLTKQRETELSFALSRVVLPLCFALVLLVAIVGYYNQRVTGNAALMPWSLHYQQYVVVPVFVWQKPKPKNEWPVYRHDILRRYQTEAELNLFERHAGAKNLIRWTGNKLREFWYFYLGPMLTPLLLLLPILFIKDRRTRLPLAICATVIGGSLLTVTVFPHYIAPVAGLIFLLMARALEYLAQVRPAGKAVGPVLAGLVIAGSVAATLYRVTLYVNPAPRSGLYHRAEIIKQLQSTTDRHLILVSYGDRHDIHQEWVFNGADLDNAKILWARDMEDEKNQELVRYYPTRKFWRLYIDDDREKPALEAYSVAKTSQ